MDGNLGHLDFASQFGAVVREYGRNGRSRSDDLNTSPCTRKESMTVGASTTRQHLDLHHDADPTVDDPMSGTCGRGHDPMGSDV